MALENEEVTAVIQRTYVSIMRCTKDVLLEGWITEGINGTKSDEGSRKRKCVKRELIAAVGIKPIEACFVRGIHRDVERSARGDLDGRGPGIMNGKAVRPGKVFGKLDSTSGQFNFNGTSRYSHQRKPLIRPCQTAGEEFA